MAEPTFEEKLAPAFASGNGLFRGGRWQAPATIVVVECRGDV